ncbi:MAG: heavy-metal-associated domain-containing protein [Tetragenococcus halophilus]|nr:heavy-metal-associated domain-containing protein [Tetragenococcus halophilus]
MEKVIIQLGTLTCPSCMQKIEQAVKKENGVEKVIVLFNASKVKVEHDDQTSKSEIKNSIEKLGYKVEKVR